MEVTTTEKIDIERLREQAKSMKSQMPELFRYLSQRDEATAEMVQTIAQAIPHPDDLPMIEIPFVNAVIDVEEVYVLQVRHGRIHVAWHGEVKEHQRTSLPPSHRRGHLRRAVHTSFCGT